MTTLDPTFLNMLQSDPTPVGPDQPVDLSDSTLPQSVADNLLELPGVDGAWIESEPSGERVVVLHYTPPGRPELLPRRVDGLRVKIVGGEPIRAGG